MLTLIRGIPGSGKSTLAREMLKAGEVQCHLEADMFFMSPEGGYVFDPMKIKDAHQWCQDSTRFALELSTKVVVSNTFVKKWEMEPYFKMAEEIGVEVKVITATGDYESVHDVPEEVIQRMKDTWEEI